MDPGKQELRILTPVGMLGYGFDTSLFWKAIEDGVDVIILDSGSTDGGPSKLALGATTFAREAYARDLSVLLEACHSHHVPVVISSAGGNGEDDAVDMFLEMIRSTIRLHHYRSMKVVAVKANVSKALIQQKRLNSMITSCGAAPPLQEQDINDARLIVAQMGPEPIQKAMMEHPDFDILVVGRSYDPAPFVAYCGFRGFTDLGVNYHMGKIMECGASCATPKSTSALAVVKKEPSCFEIRPLDPFSRCRVESVAAHALYENARPDVLYGPGGALLLADAIYEQVDDRTVRVSQAKFVPSDTYTVKLEGARVAGYHGIVMGAVRDPILIGQIDELKVEVIAAMEKKLGFEFDCKIHVYGNNGVMEALEPVPRSVPKEIAIIGHVRAKTTAQAKETCKLLRTYLMHAPYPHQVATGGNLAMPINPCDLSLGPACEFCVYHLMEVDDPTKLFPVSHETVSPQSGIKPYSPILASSQQIRKSKIKSTVVSKSDSRCREYFLTPRPPSGYCYLGDIAAMVRSKNAGPYELTFDVRFTDQEIFDEIKASGVLTKECIAKLYNIPVSEVLVCMFWPSALAFKATIKRPRVCGSFGENDTHGSQQHVPLLYLQLPCRSNDNNGEATLH
ncbi:hypothetical protein KCU66_g4431, partial [Aureobasidium melanogenum]